MTDTPTHTQTHTHPDLHVLSPRQVRDLFGLHATTLNRWLKKGSIPSFRIEGRVFIPRAALMELMQPRVPAPAKRRVLSAAEAWDADHPSR